MPTLGGHFFKHRAYLHMFGLKKIFANPATTAATTPAAATAAPAACTTPAPTLLQREPVFDRRQRIAGHLLRLHQVVATAGSTAAQNLHDETLLALLVEYPPEASGSLFFLPLSTSHLWHSTVDRLPGEKIVILLQLDAPCEAAPLCTRIQALQERGLSVGLFRNPRHPAFGEAIACVDYGAVDIEHCDPESIRDFSAAYRAIEGAKRHALFATGIANSDELRLCQQWHFDYFHGDFCTQPAPNNEVAADPHKVQLLQLLRLVQSDAENPQIAQAMKQDPLLAFRILRYLNSPALGLAGRIESMEQALLLLGRQRLFRWLSVLLFSVRDPQFGDWLLVESALTRGRLMELLGSELRPQTATDSLFLTGVFSCLDRLLRRPLPELLADMPLPDTVRAALLHGEGPLAPLLQTAIASDTFDLQRLEQAAQASGLAATQVNRAFLAATAWASEVTAHWE